jgi:hypothetical protein
MNRSEKPFIRRDWVDALSDALDGYHEYRSI